MSITYFLIVYTLSIELGEHMFLLYVSIDEVPFCALSFLFLAPWREI